MKLIYIAGPFAGINNAKIQQNINLLWATSMIGAAMFFAIIFLGEESKAVSIASTAAVWLFSFCAGTCLDIFSRNASYLMELGMNECGDPASIEKELLRLDKSAHRVFCGAMAFASIALSSILLGL